MPDSVSALIKKHAALRKSIQDADVKIALIKRDLDKVHSQHVNEQSNRTEKLHSLRGVNSALFAELFPTLADVRCALDALVAQHNSLNSSDKIVLAFRNSKTGSIYPR